MKELSIYSVLELNFRKYTHADIKNMQYFSSREKNAMKILQLSNTFQKKIAFYKIFACRILVR